MFAMKAFLRARSDALANQSTVVEAIAAAGPQKIWAPTQATITVAGRARGIDTGTRFHRLELATASAKAIQNNGNNGAA